MNEHVSKMPFYLTLTLVSPNNNRAQSEAVEAGHMRYKERAVALCRIMYTSAGQECLLKHDVQVNLHRPLSQTARTTMARKRACEALPHPGAGGARSGC